MNDRYDILGSVAVAAMLVLVAWGNAIAMFVVSALGVLFVLIMYKRL